jgi:hydrogenase-4 component E
MTESLFVSLVDLASGGIVLVSVLIVWRRDATSMVRLLRAQGAFLGAIPVVSGIRDGDAQLVVVGVAVATLRGVVFPRLIGARLRGGTGSERVPAPLVNTTAALLITAGLTVMAFVVTRPLVALEASPMMRAVPVGFAVVLVGIFLLVSDRRAVTQIAGFLVLDNGIDTVAFLATSGVPVIVELGASLDVLLALVILGVLAGRMFAKFGGTDLDDLRQLRD